MKRSGATPTSSPSAPPRARSTATPWRSRRSSLTLASEAPRRGTSARRSSLASPPTPARRPAAPGRPASPDAVGVRRPAAPSPPAAPTLADVFSARARLRPHLAPTPLAKAPALADYLGLDVRLKLEVLQPTGAFKVRGGINLVAAIDAGAEPRPRGFVTASTGNLG